MKKNILIDKTISNTLEWLRELKESADFKVVETSLNKNSNWILENGIIHHISNRFFNIVGVEYINTEGKSHSQPMIEQREVGTLGFILNLNKEKPEILVQAKIEPGNVGVIQLAPSCQATESNADRVHGGSVSPLSDVFGNDEVNIISSTLQSEQGTRFLDKFNRNVLATLQKKMTSLSNIHKWLPVDEALKMLGIDYLFNTDARSVLVCSDWEKLVGRKPFSISNTTISKELSTSFFHKGLFKSTVQVKKQLNLLRKSLKKPEIISLHDLPDYEVNKAGVFSKSQRSFNVKIIEVHTRHREVRSWSQPIVDSLGPGKVELICARRNRILHFLFKTTIEPGLANKAELGPSSAIEPGDSWSKVKNDEKSKKILIESWQSEEGGRFYLDKNLYQIIDVGETYEVPEGSFWLSLKQVTELLKEGGWITNEARSALSLILTWL